MKLFIIFGLVILITTTCNAQFSFKIHMGSSYNHLITDVSNRKFVTNKTEIGYSVGIQFKYEITKFIGFETGIGFIQKNYSFIRTESYEGIFDKYTNYYVQIPFTLQIKIFEKNKYQIFFNNGVFISYWSSAKINGMTPNVFNSTNQIGSDGQIIQDFHLTNYDAKYHFDPQKDNRFEFGLHIGLNFQYNLSERKGFFLECMYYQSLTDVQRNYMVNQISKINQTFLVSVGFSLKFNAIKK